MPPRSWQDRAQDILSAIAEIRRQTAGISADTFAVSETLRTSVAFHLIVIGEAVNHLPESITQRSVAVDWDGPRGLRNFLIHEYFRIRFDIVWDILVTELPTLEQELQRLLDEGEHRSGSPR